MERRPKDLMSVREFLDTARFEGEAGVENLAYLIQRLSGPPAIRQLQFRNGCHVTSITEFLADNPGCVEAMLDWIQDNYSECNDQEPDEDGDTVDRA